MYCLCMKCSNPPASAAVGARTSSPAVGKFTPYIDSPLTYARCCHACHPGRPPQYGSRSPSRSLRKAPTGYPGDLIMVPEQRDSGQPYRVTRPERVDYWSVGPCDEARACTALLLCGDYPIWILCPQNSNALLMLSRIRVRPASSIELPSGESHCLSESARA